MTFVFPLAGNSPRHLALSAIAASQSTLLTQNNASIFWLVNRQPPSEIFNLYLKITGHPLATIVYPTRYTWPTVASRELKIGAASAIPPPFFLLDIDLLLVKPIPEEGLSNQYICGCIDVNQPDGTLAWQPLEKLYMQHLGWTLRPEFYLNSGVLYFGSGDYALLVSTWHSLWKQQAASVVQHYDQPALNAALANLQIEPFILEKRFNAAVGVNPNLSKNALIWHYYQSSPFSRRRSLLNGLIYRLDKMGKFDDFLFRASVSRQKAFYGKTVALLDKVYTAIW